MDKRAIFTKFHVEFLFYLNNVFTAVKKRIENITY